MEGSALKKRKLLNQKHCKEAKYFLNGVMLKKFQLSVTCYKETHDLSAYLCHLCDGQLMKISKLQEEITSIKEDIAKKVSRLTKVIDSDAQVHTTLQDS